MESPLSRRGTTFDPWRLVLLANALLALAALAGCGSPPPKPPMPSLDISRYGLLPFNDGAQTNVKLPAEELASLEFVNSTGQPTKLGSLLGKKKLVLVVMRGYLPSQPAQKGPVVNGFCLYCCTQTSRLIANYEEFRKRNAEVVVVVPVAKKPEAAQLDNFLVEVKKQPDAQGASSPFPLLVDLELRAVNQLGIRDDLAKPATYIFDERGQVQFAYVGQHMADRPSVKAILAQLDQAKPPQAKPPQEKPPQP